MTHTIRSATADDEAAVIDLWTRCGLVVSHNDPATDFRFARGGPSSDVLVATDGERRIAGSAMVGHDGHRGWLYYVAVEAQLMVRETNGEVVRFYQRIGYEPMPRINLQKWLKKP